MIVMKYVIDHGERMPSLLEDYIPLEFDSKYTFNLSSGLFYIRLSKTCW